MAENTDTLSDLFGGNDFSIPKYQRGYQWKWDDQGRDLMRDIEYVQEKFINGEYGTNMSGDIEESLRVLYDNIASEDEQIGESIIELLESQDQISSSLTHYFGNIVFKKDFVKKDGVRREIIDGQQRLTTITLIMKITADRLKMLSETAEDSDFSDFYESPSNSQALKPSVMSDIVKTTFSDTKSFRMDERSRDYFNILLSHIDTEELENNAYLNTNFEPSASRSDASTGPEKRMYDVVGGLNEYYNRIEQRISSFADGEHLHQILYLYYALVVNTLRLCFEVTSYEVESKSEAGRLFQVINDRGKDIELWDRIRSLLVSRCNELQDEGEAKEMTNKIYDTVGRTLQKLTENTNFGDSDVKRFFKHHWNLFSGYSGTNVPKKYDSDLYMHMKKSDNHMSRSRSPEEYRVWVEKYLESLESCAESYKQMCVRNTLYNKNVGESEISNEKLMEAQTRLHSINMYGTDSDIISPLIAIHQCYGQIDERFLNMVRVFDSYIFRVSQVNSLRDAWKTRDDINAMSHILYWIGLHEQENYDEEEIMGEDNKIFRKKVGINDVSADLDKAYAKFCNHIERIIKKKAPDEVTRERLHTSGFHPDGESDAGEWDGFETPKGIKYLLYIFNRQENPKNPETKYEDGTSFFSKKDLMEVEHIKPNVEQDEVDDRNDITEDEFEELREYQNKLGNLTLLTPTENRSAEDNDFKSKYRNVFVDNPEYEITQKIGQNYGESADWNSETVDERTERMISWILDWWSSGMSRVELHVDEDVDLNNSDDVSDDKKARILEEVRDKVEILKANKPVQVGPEHKDSNVVIYGPRIEIIKRDNPNVFVNENDWKFWGEFEERDEKKMQKLSVKEDENGELKFLHNGEEYDSVPGVAVRKPEYVFEDEGKMSLSLNSS